MSSKQPEQASPGSWPASPLRTVVEQLFVGLPVSRYQAKGAAAAVEEPVLGVSDLGDGLLAPRAGLTKVSLRPDSFDRFRVQAGDILLSCRATTLKAARVTEEGTGLIASSNLIVLRPGGRLLPALLLALLRSSPWQELLRLRSRSSTSLIQLTLRDVEDLPVPLPPSELQQQLASLIDAEEEHHRCALRAAALRRALVEGLVSDVLLGPASAASSRGEDHA